MFVWKRTCLSASPDQRDQSPVFSQLLDRACNGESEALSMLYRQFLTGVFDYIAIRVPDRATAEDLTSEVFLQMVEGIHQLRARNEVGFAAWILQIARTIVAGYYRKCERLPVCLPLDPTNRNEEEEQESCLLPAIHPDTDPVRLAEARDEWSTVVNAINTLTEEQRQVLIGRLILGYDVATVAQMIGKNANAVKALQFRALQSLQRRLGRKTLPEQAIPTHVRHQGGTR
jgi:RNA polymerase sigma-70 factor (ECF subfamily)